jgi:hypothetical protein
MRTSAERILLTRSAADLNIPDITAFEAAWIARGFSLPRRVRHIEERWAYYLAFGTFSNLEPPTPPTQTLCQQVFQPRSCATGGTASRMLRSLHSYTLT